MIPEIVKKEDNNLSRGDCLLIKPNSIIEKVWQFVLIGLLMYTATIMPYSIALISDSENYPFYVIDTLIDFLFMTDMIVNLNSPIKIKENKFEYRRKKIILKYLKTWFFVDLLASLPMNLISAYLMPSTVNLKG